MGVIYLNDIPYGSGGGGGNSGDYYIVDTVAELPVDLTILDRKIYFCIDDLRFHLWDGTTWSIVSTGGAVVRELTKVQYDALTPAEQMDGTIYFVTDEEGGGGGSSNLTQDLTASVSLGGITAGTKFDAGTSLEDILRELLSPILYPTFVDPSVTITAIGNKIIKKGGTLNTTITANFDRGSIDPAYGTNGYRSGAAIDYTLNSGTPQASNIFNVAVNETQPNYVVVVSYDIGDQPKDSAGNDYMLPLPAGTVNSNIITYEFTMPIYANVTTATIMDEFVLVSKSSKEMEFSFPATTTTNPECFDMPNDYIVSKIEVYNVLTSKWEDASTQFTTTTTTHNDAAGNPVNYNRYTCNYAGNIGARDIKVTWN